MNKELDLTVSSYGKVKDVKYDVVILPWGATEPHNYHLPYLTDCMIPHRIAVDAARLALQQSSVRSMVMPPVAFGAHNPGQRELPFCIHTRYSTQQAILEDIVASLYAQGMRKLIILSGHGGNHFKGMIRDLAFTYPDFLIIVAEWFNVIPSKGYFEAEIDDHAGELETSVMMHYYPELINLEEAGDGESKPFAIASLNEKIGWAPRHWDKATVDSGVGNPKKASAEKGERYLEPVIQKLAKLFTEVGIHKLY
ncbi:creatininase family protein [Bacteroides sp. 51]|uniref:creatininase family protein n=1 Tax=Bacteroides sp. 51 TaxID=2302938 RepID=UPI0013D17B1D|nr:creatininase family protein [Bacteroides sp. 51]NDV83724.1 creatininase family protein [Bacteroides sp. 51]